VVTAQILYITLRTRVNVPIRKPLHRHLLTRVASSQKEILFTVLHAVHAMKVRVCVVSTATAKLALSVTMQVGAAHLRAYSHHNKQKEATS